jgi:uncharacterized protein (DUF2141 family)
MFMRYLRRIPALLFALSALLALSQCGRRGTPGGGPEDKTPPVLIKAEPPNNTTGFNEKRIRLYFDEYVRLQDVQNQLIISPPLKNKPEITPLGGARKYVEILIRDTLLENTTYTFNFGQSVVDNNEGNPYNFLTYVFSTGDKIDSLSLSGAIADAKNLKPDPFISVMLHEIDSAYTDSVIYKKLPYYLTNTLDSAVTFSLNNLKPGSYRLIALKDVGKNNLFDQGVDKIGFVADTITLPTDSLYVLNLFREVPNYGVLPPSFTASNRIVFGYYGDTPPLVSLLSELPDTVATKLTKEPGKDSLNLWITPFEQDSLVFILRHPEMESKTDTFSVKPISRARDTLSLSLSPAQKLSFADTAFLRATLPLQKIDTSLFRMMRKDSTAVVLSPVLDTIANRVRLDFEKEPEQTYLLDLFPGAVTDFFGGTNDTLRNRWTTGSREDYGILRLRLQGNVRFPILAELINEKEEAVRSVYMRENAEVEFTSLDPGNYRIRLIYDRNENGRWDTGNFLHQIQPERIMYLPGAIEIRANWEKVETFTIQN